MAKAKDLGGRPLKFTDEKELQAKIDEYFKSCWEQKIDMWGNPLFWKDEKGNKIPDRPVLKQVKPYTIGGLAVFLDCSRDTLVEYGHKKKFSDTIKRAKDIIYAYKEERLSVAPNAAGIIFDLKNNYGWKDKTEQDITSDGLPIQVISYTKQK